MSGMMVKTIFFQVKHSMTSKSIWSSIWESHLRSQMKKLLAAAEVSRVNELLSQGDLRSALWSEKSINPSEIIEYISLDFANFHDKSMTICELYERYVRKRTLEKYQSQSEVIKMMLYLQFHTLKNR